MGGTMPAAMTAAMTRKLPAPPAASPVVAKTYAVLLMGPPRSKHIIRPRTMPRRIAPAPVRLFGPTSKPFAQPAEGAAGAGPDEEAGCDAGPVGDGVGDVARQRRDEEAEAEAADLEGRCAEVVD